jgi:hypothetical protein
MEREPAGCQCELTVRQHGAAMRAIRRVAQRGLADTAARIGIKSQTLTNIENNSAQAGKQVMRDWANFFCVPVAAITRTGCACGIGDDAAEPEPDDEADAEEDQKAA